MLLVTQHINIIAKEQFMVKSFCNNFDWVCPFYWGLNTWFDFNFSIWKNTHRNLVVSNFNNIKYF